MKAEAKEQQIKTQTEERPYTFKIIKKRSPWNTNVYSLLLIINE